MTHRSVYHSLNITDTELPAGLKVWEQMFGLGGVHTLTRMLLAAVSRWLVATARISTCGAIELSNCPRASQQSIKTPLFITRWHDRTLRGKGFYTGCTVSVLNGNIMEYNQLIKGSVHFQQRHIFLPSSWFSDLSLRQHKLFECHQSFRVQFLGFLVVFCILVWELMEAGSSHRMSRATLLPIRRELQSGKSC